MTEGEQARLRGLPVSAILACQARPRETKWPVVLAVQCSLLSSSHLQTQKIMSSPEIP